MTDQMNLIMALYKVGDRIKVHPATDRWMRGDRFAEIVSKGRIYFLVKYERSGDIRKLHPDNIIGKVE